MNKTTSTLVLVVVLLTIGCGGGKGGPTAPSPPTPASNAVTVLVAAAVSGGGRYTANLNGQSYTAANGFSVALEPGMHELSGTYSGGMMIVGFALAPAAAGGVQTGSVQSVSGSTFTTMPCGVMYNEMPGTQSFRLRFVVSKGVNNVC